MKKNITIFILGFIILMIYNLLYTHQQLFYLLIVTTLYLIFISSFSHIKYKKNTSLISIILCILLISFVYFIISYIIAKLFFNTLNSLFITMGLCIFIIPSINIFMDIKSIKRKNIIKIIFISTIIITSIIMGLCNKFLNININITGSIIYLSQLIILIPIIILNRKLIKFNNINLKKGFQIISTNIQPSIIRISNILYYYLTLIIIYYYLTKIYLYYDKTVTTVIVDIYMYLYYIIVFLSVILYPKEKETNLNKQCIKIINKTVPILILISILSGPILLILYNNYNNAYILSFLIFEVLFIIIYNICISSIIEKRIFNITILIGIILKCILTIPLINSMYRMGYSMIYGDIISTIISLFIPIIIIIFYNNKIKKDEFSKYFTNLLTIIYENIVLCIILLLVQLLIPIIPNNKLHALGIIIVYYTIFIFLKKIKKRLRK